jgi:polar amino acid transport system substrate-binding protein
MFQFDYTYLVPAGSPITQIADADKTGTRIAIMDSHASALALKLIIRQANIISAELPEQAFGLLRSREADVFASPRDVLLDFAEQLPESRVLADAFGVNRVGIAIRKGREGLLGYLDAVVEEVKADGTIARLIDEGKLRGFSVAD